jgi:GDPmannose 4,6-dehydratase
MPSWPSSTRPDVTAVPTALVTGIAGQDGAYLTRQLLERGYSVVGLVQPRAEMDPVVAPFLEGADLREGDLRDLASLGAVVDDSAPDEVYNLAGISSVSASWRDPVVAADGNALGVLRLLTVLDEHAAATGRRPRLLQASSAEMFGAADGPGSEQSPMRPRNPYAVAKAFAHEMVATFRDGRGLFASTVILFNHESPLRTADFVSRKITHAVAAISLGLADELVLGDLNARRDWGFAGDYTRAMWLALQHDQPGDYVVATGEARSVRDFVALAFAVVGIRDWERYVRSAAENLRPTESPVLLGDSTRARQVLGWEPEVSFEVMVEGMVRHDVEALTTATREAAHGA